MKTLLIVLPLLLFQISPTDLKPTATETANNYAVIFRKQIDPYLKKFVQLQYGEPKTEDERMLLEIEYTGYAQKADQLNTNFVRNVSIQDDLTKDVIYRQLDRLYRYEFPGLDKAFFDNVKNEINNLK
jgi:hypothetical protein